MNAKEKKILMGSYIGDQWKALFEREGQMNAKEKAIESLRNMTGRFYEECEAILSLPEVREYFREEYEANRTATSISNDYFRKIDTVKQAALLREAKEVLDKYGIHDLACALSVTIAPPGTKCTCGLEEALAKLEGK